MEHITQKLQTIELNIQDMINLQREEDTELRLPTKWRTSSVVIGIDYYHEFVKGTAKWLRSGFEVIDTEVGAVMCGKGRIAETLVPTTILTANKILTEHLKGKDVDRYWKLEQIGIEPADRETMESLAVKQFSETIRRDEDGRYSVNWPWKTAEPRAPYNFGLCLGRLKPTLKRIKDDPTLWEQYDETFKQQEGLHIIERVDRKQNGTIISYIPHQPVITAHKETTKLQIVFDASSKDRNGDSLNNNLLRGPTLLRNMCRILLRFRSSPYVLIVDVEKAFLQIGLNENDRVTTRFLWVNDANLPADGNNLITYRFCRIPFGVISNPFLLAATLEKHLQYEGSETARKILKNLYVDNVMLNANSTDEAIRLYTETKALLNSAKMNIRQFTSDNYEFMKRIPTEDNETITERMKVLGISWDPIKDKIVVGIPNTCCDLSTKTEILQFVAACYDLLGFLTPIFVEMKVFLQSLWKNKYGWDNKLNSAKQRKWQQIAEKWTGGEITHLTRFAFIVNCSTQLHIFTDASSKAYAVAVYVRSLKNNFDETALVYSRRRLTPTSGMSIPRLELMGMLLGVRAGQFVKEQLELPDSAVHLWCDSKSILYWAEKPIDKLKMRFSKTVSARFKNQR
ncbi:hypothetical protein AB6A40_006469 [Gnathostoma spinigerum]|uniref:Reverse transcriptase domain-containing protein n=1 Tax=Gnathostoma spinigerum TaxID=75299 RepID=A0ABD6EIG1_9BILA